MKNRVLTLGSGNPSSLFSVKLRVQNRTGVAYDLFMSYTCLLLLKWGANIVNGKIVFPSIHLLFMRVFVCMGGKGRGVSKQ